jgi:hypothetical protein
MLCHLSYVKRYRNEIVCILLITIANLPANQHPALFPPTPQLTQSRVSIIAGFILVAQFSAILLFITPDRASLTRGSHCDKVHSYNLPSKICAVTRVSSCYCATKQMNAELN